MADFITSKYVRTNTTRPSRHEAVTAPIPLLNSDATYGGHGYHMYWKCIDKPYVDESKTHQHDFDQYLVFLGGDPSNMLDLGGEVHLTLGEDVDHLEEHVFTQYTTVYIKAGLYHCPLIFKNIKQSFIFYDFVSVANYSRK